MKKLALQVEHKYKNRVVGLHVLEGGLTTLGSSRTANIRVLGDEVGGFHAAFELDGEQWTVADLGSETGTWINKKPVIEEKIDGATIIHIGGHQLKATPHVYERELFAKTLAEEKGEFVYHQVVILRKNLLQRTFLLERAQSYRPSYPEAKGYVVAKTAPKRAAPGGFRHPSLIVQVL